MGLQITGWEENASILPDGFKTLLPLRTDVSLCETGGKEAGHNLLKNNIVIEDMTKTG